MIRSLPLAIALALISTAAACARPADDTASAAAATPAPAPAEAPVAAAVDQPRFDVAASAAANATIAVALPRVTVHKSPTCGCCGLWVQHMQQQGFAVDVVETDDLEPIRKLVGVPAGHASCHTAQVDGYFVEGHVPADDVKRLLRERPAARGITAPGMPLGSPGMEVPSGATPPYRVLLVGDDGAVSEFARHGSD